MIRGTLDLHTVVTLLAVVIGAELWGFWGALIAVPIAGLIQYVAGRMIAPYNPRGAGHCLTDHPDVDPSVVTP